MLNVNRLVWSVLLAFCVLFWWSVIGCVSEQLRHHTVDQPLDTFRRQAVDVDNPQPSLAFALLGGDKSTGRRGTSHVRPMPTLADVRGGLPIVMTPGTRPVVGRSWVVDWLTRPVAPRPDRRCALLVTLKPPGQPKPIPGAGGSMLQVPPDFVLVPERVQTVDTQARPHRFFELVQDPDGHVRLRVVWPRSLDGLDLWCQLVVEDRRVAAGCVTTPVVEVHVGS